MKKKQLGIAVLAATLAAPLLAEKQNTAEIYLGAARYFWDSDRDLDDSNSLELGAELPISEALSFELWLSDFDADTDVGSIEFDGRRYAGGALYHLKEGDYRPFISAGAAHQNFEADNSSDVDETLLYVGAGAKKYFDNNILLRGELLALNSLDHEMTDLGARISIGYAFGAGRTSGVVSPEASTERAVSVEDKPETVMQEKQEAPVEKEVETKPEQVSAPKSPPANDDDADGVLNRSDLCPETEAGVTVDSKGCPEKLVKDLEIELHIKFATNSADFADTKGEIKELAYFLEKYAGTELTIEGHTDGAGSASYNKTLSQKRADAVKAMLVNEYSIDASRIQAIGYGEEKPIASNDTAEGRAANRRVVGTLRIENAEIN